MVEKRERFKSIYPNKYFADKENVEALSSYLRSIDFLVVGERLISCSIPGQGNMNYVIRILTNKRSFILKQSRPWVEKYPSIDAPIQRINIEAKYYESLSGLKELEEHSPEIYEVDMDNFVILMEDLGDVKDYTYLYRQNEFISEEDVTHIANYLCNLHSIKVVDFPDNLEMRKLNHEHIFNYPYQSNSGFDLNEIQKGLAALAINEVNSADIVKQIKETGKLYLAKNGDTLLHGDFYPGSWMKSDKLCVLDAEFSFVGPAEFDLGVFIAHMKMADQPNEKTELFLSKYNEGQNIVLDLAYRFAGIEILRRLLGVAQLPLEHSIEKKAELMSVAKHWILN